MSRFKLPQRLTSRRPRSSRRVVSQGTQATDRRDFEMQEADRFEVERDRHDPEVQAVPTREFAEIADAEPARGRTLSRTAGRALSAIVGVLLVVALLWIAGELHYQSCIQAAQARTPAASASQGSLPPKLNNALDRSLGRAPIQNREEAVRGCSRLPF